MASVRALGRALGEAAPLRALRMQLKSRLLATTRRLCQYAALHSSFLALCLICLSWSLISLPLYLLLPRSAGRRFGRYGIMAGFRLFARWLAVVGVYRLDLTALDQLRAAPPLILAPNHPSLIDAVLILTRHPDLACVMKSELTANVLFGPGARLARYIRNDSTRQMVREAVTELKRGGLLLLFPEGTRTVRAPVNGLKKSVAVIARRARVPVQTLIIETDSAFLSKGWPLFACPPFPVTYRVRLGRRFDPPQDNPSFMLELEQYYRAELQGGLTTQWLGTARR